MNTTSHRSPRCEPRSPKGDTAFTLLELLAVIAIVAILFALQIPALARMTRQTKVAHCSENLRQVTYATHMFAHDNNDRLPSNGSAGFWAWDMLPSVATALERYGAHWKLFYCPGTAPRFTDDMNFQLWNFGGFRVVGYAFTFPESFALASTNVNRTLTPSTIQTGPGSFHTPLASEQVLLADATISAIGQNNEVVRETYNYTSIPGGFSPAHTSPHLSGKLPLGGNVSMLDGHVVWRDFADMHPRTTGNSPVFWW